MKVCVLKDSLFLSSQSVLRSYASNKRSGKKSGVIGGSCKNKSPLKAILDSLNYDAAVHKYIN